MAFILSAVTEGKMLDLLAKRYRSGDRGNGPAWAFVPQVRNAAGFNATRTIDAIAMSLWPSRGLEIHGHEIKCSRSDWLREMRDPAKAEAFAKHCDRWWLVTANPTIVKEGELPPTWGEMTLTGRGLVISKQAPLLPKVEGEEWMTRSFLAALLRSAARTHDVTPEEVREAVAAARAEQHAQIDRERAGYEQRLAEMRDRIRIFEDASGVRLKTSDEAWDRGADPAVVGAALRAVLDGESQSENLLRRFRSLADQAERLAADARRAAGIEVPA